MVLPYINMNPPQVYTCSPSWTFLPPPSLYHPSGSSQCTSPKHPVSCIEPGLATHFIYDIIHVSMPFSQIIPPSPSPTESKDCSIHQCLFCCLIYRVIVTIFLNSIPNTFLLRFLEEFSSPVDTFLALWILDEQHSLKAQVLNRCFPLSFSPLNRRLLGLNKW